MFTRGRLMAVGALALLLALSTTTAGPAQAATSGRRDAVMTQAAVIAEVVHHGASTGGLPKKMTRKILRDRFGYALPTRFKIKKYKRLSPTTYRICIVHKKGGWATWHSGKGKLRASGHGATCRF